jgi:hypothetical protein
MKKEVESGTKFQAFGVECEAIEPTGFTHPDHGAFWRCKATDESKELLKREGKKPIQEPFVYPAGFILYGLPHGY